MPEVNRIESWQAPIGACYDVITDYRAYPAFIDGIDGVRVLWQDENGAEVEYHLNLIKKFKYTLRLTHQRPASVAWTFMGGDIFKRNEGSWRLEEQGEGATGVAYFLDVDIKGFVPAAIVRSLTAKNLPGMMDSLHRRAREVGA